MVIWLVGLSGAGKSTIARLLYARLKLSNQATVLVDGDEIRNLFHHDQKAGDYSLSARRVSAERLHSLCGWLDKQGIDVICSAISMFPDIILKNRQEYSRFFEVYVDVSLENLSSRDNKGLYQAALRGDMINVVGVDLPYPSPQAPDLTIYNSFQQVDLTGYVEMLYQLVIG